MISIGRYRPLPLRRLYPLSICQCVNVVNFEPYCTCVDFKPFLILFLTHTLYVGFLIAYLIED